MNTNTFYIFLFCLIHIRYHQIIITTQFKKTLFHNKPQQ